MKKILSIAIALMLCFAMVSMAEAPASTRVPSPTAGPRPTDEGQATAAPTKAPSDAASSNSSSSTGNAEAAATEAPAPVEQAEAIVIADENVNVQTAPAAEIQALIAEIAANAQKMFPTEIFNAVQGKKLLSATIATFEFVKIPAIGEANQIIPLKVDAPSDVKDGASIYVVVGVKNAYGEYTYQMVMGTVAGGKIAFDLMPELWQSMQGQANTQVMFFQA